MRDQATELRNLMRHTVRAAQIDHGPSPRLLVLSGGKGGVGVTTLSVHLSLALAGQGARVVLVDADPYRADVATMCGLEERGSISDVLSSRCDIHEVLRSGPCGIQVAPGDWAPTKPTDYSEIAQRRLLEQLQTLGRHADMVLVDAGNSGSEVVRRFWLAADDVLLVTTPEPMAVMDCYATVKRLSGDGPTASIRLLVNHADSRCIGEDVHHRIDGSCQRFLGSRVGLLGHVPHCPVPPRAGGERLHPDTTLALEQLAVSLIVEQSQRTDQVQRANSPRDDRNKHANSAQLEPGIAPMNEQGVSPSVEVNLQRLNQL